MSFEHLVRYLHDNNVSFTLLTALVMVTYVMALQWLIRRQRARREERRSVLFDVLTNGLASDTLEDLDDIVNLYKGAFKIPSDDLTYRSGLSSFLREYLVRLVAGKTPATDPESVSKRKELVTFWLRESERSAPFADVPEVERHLIEDISGFVDAGDSESVKRKLEQLASSITVREQDYQRISESNRWSIPLAVIGAILTVIFGIISLLA